ncbi:MAG: cytochrome oxidase small assembly protein [Gemmatimonadota bacterium]
MSKQISDEQQASNKRTALVLLSIVLVFFAGIIVRRWLFGG